MRAPKDPSMSYGQPSRSLEEVRDVLDAISIGSIYDRPHFRLMPKGDGYLIQFVYFEADVERPEAGPVEQRCRKWYVSPFSTETEIVRTAFKAVQASMEHRLGEHFRYRGAQIHSPHLHVGALLETAEHLDRRD